MRYRGWLFGITRTAFVTATIAFGVQFWSAGALAGTATISILTNTGSDTLISRAASFLVVTLDTGPDTATAVNLYFEWLFSNGNIVGPLYDTGMAPNVRPSAKAKAVFENLAWNPFLGDRATDPDTTVCSYLDFGGTVVWKGEDTVLSLCFSPSDTGTLQIFDVFIGGGEHTSVVDSRLFEFDLNSDLPLIHVVECTDADILPGDVTRDRLVTAADIVYLVNYVFKSGPAPKPIEELGDVNCSTSISSSDILALYHFIFKGGNPPCDVCSTL